MSFEKIKTMAAEPPGKFTGRAHAYRHVTPSKRVERSAGAETVQNVAEYVEEYVQEDGSSRFYVVSRLVTTKIAYGGSSDGWVQADVQGFREHASLEEAMASRPDWVGAGSVPVMGTKLKLLLIEDDDGVRRSTRRLLSLDYEVTEASCGEEGLDLARSREFDAVVCDLEMPGMDGLEVHANLPEGLRERFLLWTGAPEKAEGAPGIRVLEKPAQREELSGALREMIGGER